MIGYVDIMKASEDARGKEFLSAESELLNRRNPLGHFFYALSLFHNPGRSRSVSPYKRVKLSHNTDEDAEINVPAIAEENMSDISQSSFNPPSALTENKGTESLEPYCHSSVVPRPVRVVYEESLMRNLQNKFVDTVLTEIWGSLVPIPWAKNRQIYLEYRPYHPSEAQSNLRTFKSSFRCRLRGNTGNAVDRVSSVSDGALVLKTDAGKKIWGLQGAALAFDVLNFLVGPNVSLKILMYIG
jgi:hypothetical protein